MGVMRAFDNYARASLVGATSNTAGAILRAGEALLVAGLLVGTGRLGRASGAFVDDVALVDGVLLVGLWGCVLAYVVHQRIADSNRLTKLGVGIGGVRINGVLHGFIVGLYGDLALASTALVLVVLDLAGGDILGAHDCVLVVIRDGKSVVFGCILGTVGTVGFFV